MAKKKSHNAALIAALQPTTPLAYDPELMQAMADNFSRQWQKLETLRQEVYRHIMPAIWLEVLEAERAGDADMVKAIQMRADRQWCEVMGGPAITSWANLEIIMAAVAAAGYPATNAGLHAWTIAKSKVDDKVEENRPSRRTRWQNVHDLLDQEVGGGDGWDSDKRRKWAADYNRDYGKVTGYLHLTGKKLGAIIRGRKRKKAD